MSVFNRCNCRRRRIKFETIEKGIVMFVLHLYSSRRQGQRTKKEKKVGSALFESVVIDGQELPHWGHVGFKPRIQDVRC